MRKVGYLQQGELRPRLMIGGHGYASLDDFDEPVDYVLRGAY